MIRHPNQEVEVGLHMHYCWLLLPGGELERRLQIYGLKNDLLEGLEDDVISFQFVCLLGSPWMSCGCRTVLMQFDYTIMCIVIV